jgi:hypothetical protein
LVIETSLHYDGRSEYRQVAYVWHPKLFITGAMVKTQRKLCEFKKKNSPLGLKNFGFCDFDIHKIQPSTYHNKQPFHAPRQTPVMENKDLQKMQLIQWKYCLSPH